MKFLSFLSISHEYRPKRGYNLKVVLWMIKTKEILNSVGLVKYDNTHPTDGGSVLLNGPSYKMS